MMLARSLIIALLFVAVRPAIAQEIGGGIYGQGMAQEHHLMPQVLVRTPSSMPLRAEASYLVDVWSRASVDLQRGQDKQYSQTHHELSGRLGYDWDALHVAAHYRYVHRPDYISHTIDVPVAYRLPDQVSILSLQPYVRFNRIGLVRNEVFSQTSQMFGVRAGYQPWLGGQTIGQVAYELQYADGYLSNPYDYIFSGPVPLPERNPDTRVSHALVIMIRRALSESISAGLRYRVFIDDWSLTSHTIEPDVAWLAWPGGLLRLRYRAYFQSATQAYRDATQLDGSLTLPPHYASDPRYAALQTHRISFDLEHTFRASFAFTTLLTLGVYRVAIRDLPRESATAFEATLWLLLML